MPERLDHFLVDRYPGISRVYLQRLISGGKVDVNGRTVRKGASLVSGDRISVAAFTLPEERTISPNPAIELRVVWESADVLVIDKPAGLSTHPNDFEDTETVANAVLARHPRVLGVGENPLRPGIVHRLDTDTSGLLIVALTQVAYGSLRSQFDARTVKKKYLALVLGRVENGGKVELPIAHHPKNARKMVTVLPGAVSEKKARVAVTVFRPLERFAAYSLLEVRTLTGRMHQVRVHLSSIGHPLAGDRIYRRPHEKERDTLGLSRHFLHAAEITFEPPGAGGARMFESALPPELDEILSRLRGVD